MGTWSKGLSRYDERSFSFQNFDMGSGLPTNGIWSVATAGTNDVWIGTRGGGLVRYDGSRFERFTTITTTNGLPSDTIFKILPVSQGVVWIGTDNGLSKLADGSQHAWRKIG
jgi:ligand-binding sensor domain-containing protein